VVGRTCCVCVWGTRGVDCVCSGRRGMGGGGSKDAMCGVDQWRGSRDESRKGHGEVGKTERIPTRSHAIVVCGRCRGEQMAGESPERRRDIYFGAKPRQRSEVVVMPYGPVLGARHTSRDPLTEGKTRIHAVHRTRVIHSRAWRSQCGADPRQHEAGGVTGVCVASRSEGWERINRAQQGPNRRHPGMDSPRVGQFRAAVARTREIPSPGHSTVRW
jgi:hypothetical protein